MIFDKASSKNWFIIERLLLWVAMALLVGYGVFCCYYILSSHEQLAIWYSQLNSCFYHANIWGTELFTPGIKSDGNLYCTLGLILSGAGFVFILRILNIKKAVNRPTLSIKVSRWDIPYLLICIIFAIGLWLWGNSLALPAFDEVFSAQHVADIHPFQSISYYMLPNNHVLYNFLNSIVFHYVTDKVYTGRIISLIAYCTIIVTIYFAFKPILKYRLLSLLMCLTLALQFFTWGFSFQARGYELYLLTEWSTLLSLFGYIRSERRSWLYLNVLSIATGYFCLPSFLYFHAAQLLFMTLYCIIYKKKETIFWKYQALAILATYLCYLPVLSFSGIESISNNSYVAAKRQTMTVFWQGTWPMMKDYFSHIFSAPRWGVLSPVLPLLFLPIILISARRSKIVSLSGLFYLCLWTTYFIITSIMKRAPFERNLIGHYSLSLAGVLLFLYWVIEALALKKVGYIFSSTVFTVILALFAAHFSLTNEKFLKETLYEYDVNGVYSFHKDRLNVIPPGSTVGFSDAEFYSYYICRKNGCIANKCPEGNDDYFVTQDNEGYPKWLSDKYQLLDKKYNYEIYKHK